MNITEVTAEVWQAWEANCPGAAAEFQEWVKSLPGIDGRGIINTYRRGNGVGVTYVAVEAPKREESTLATKHFPNVDPPFWPTYLVMTEIIKPECDHPLCGHPAFREHQQGDTTRNYCLRHHEWAERAMEELQ